MIQKLFIGLLLFSGVALGKTAASKPETKATMAKVYGSLQTLLPLSTNYEKYSSKQNRAMITRELEQLALSTQELSNHGSKENLNFAFLSRSLSRDATDALRWYSQGRYPESAFVLHSMTDACVACHSRLPAKSDFQGAKGLFAKKEIKNLQPFEKVQLLTATRQFSEALDTYERIFKDPKVHGATFSNDGLITRYLVLVIRVRNEIPRAISTLKTLRQRKDLPANLKPEIDQWLLTLETLPKSGEKAKKDELAQARDILGRGKVLNDYFADQKGLVHYIYASGLLLRYIENKPQKGPEVAEAYYLLGLSDAIVSRSLWLPQTDFFLETAIRLAPKSNLSKQAYQVLEDNINYEYSGSGGTKIPKEVQEQLKELKKTAL